LTRLVEPNDILQDTQIEAFRRIRSFCDNGGDGFYIWLVQIARRQMLQYLRARRTLKRGGGLALEHSSEFLEQLALDTHTPSQSVVRHELAFAVETCLQRIPPDNALAIRLRHLDRLTFAEVADRMQRTERAAQMLCNRGMKQLKAQLRSMSRFA
jgi:RNA polymerase sigma-70 factor (ECF subfamily)